MPPSVTELLRIDVPILQGGMSWVSRFGLASAVSEAGGLGVLGAATMEPEELRTEIRAVRVLTQRPFAVNLPLLSVRPDGSDTTRELIDVVLEERVPIVITGAGSPKHFTGELKASGAKVLHVVPSPELAHKAEAAGVDGVIAESSEAGGHVSPGGLATFSLVPQVVDAVACPVIAAGGIADGRGVLAALALGAGGVQLGTRFVATTECEAHNAFKRAVVEAPSGGSLLYCRKYHPSRGLATPIVRELVAREDAGADVDELRALRGRHRARLACVDGQIDEGIGPAGSAVGLVKKIMTVADVLTELQGDLQHQWERIGEQLDGERCAS